VSTLHFPAPSGWRPDMPEREPAKREPHVIEPIARFAQPIFHDRVSSIVGFSLRLKGSRFLYIYKDLRVACPCRAYVARGRRDRCGALRAHVGAGRGSRAGHDGRPAGRGPASMGGRVGPGTCRRRLAAQCGACGCWRVSGGGPPLPGGSAVSWLTGNRDSARVVPGRPARLVLLGLAWCCAAGGARRATSSRSGPGFVGDDGGHHLQQIIWIYIGLVILWGDGASI
jgi:hypothetical protein